MRQKRLIKVPIQGLDTSGPSTLIDSRATPNCQDVRVSYTHIKKIEGNAALGASASVPILKYFEFDREANKYLCRICTTKFQVWTDGSQTWTDKTGASALQGQWRIPVSVCATKITGKGVLVFSTFVDVIKKYDASGNIASLGGSPPHAKFLFQYKGYLVLGYIKDSGGNYYPLRVQWPDTDDPETWTEGDNSNAGYDDLDDNSEPLRGISGVGEFLVPFKSNMIYNGYLTDNSNVFQFDAVERRLGWLSNNSVKEIPGGKLIGVGKSGLVEYNGISAQLVATGIMEDLRRTINPNYIHCAFGEVLEELDEYWLWVPTGNNKYPNLIYRYNYLTKQIYKGISSSETAAALKTQLEPTTWNLKTGKWNEQVGKWNEVPVKSVFPVLVTGDYTGQGFNMDYSLKDRNGVAIDGFWDSKDYDSTFFFGDEYAHHLFHLTELFIEGALGDSVDVYYSTDEGTTYTLLDTITLTSTAATFRIPCDILAATIRLRFRNNTLNSSFEFKNFSFTQPTLREKVVNT